MVRHVLLPRCRVAPSLLRPAGQLGHRRSLGTACRRSDRSRRRSGYRTGVVTATAVWLNEQEMQAWQAFLRASIRLMERLDAELEGHGISLADYEILVHLSGEPAGRAADDRAGGAHARVPQRVDPPPRPAGRLGAGRAAQLSDRPAGRLRRAHRRRPRAASKQSAPTHVEGVRRHFIAQLHGQDLHRLAESLNAVVDSSMTAGEPSAAPDPAASLAPPSGGRPARHRRRRRGWR